MPLVSTGKLFKTSQSNVGIKSKYILEQIHQVFLQRNECLFAAISSEVVIRKTERKKKTHANFVRAQPRDVGTQFARSSCHFTTICLLVYGSASDLSSIFPVSALTTLFVSNGTCTIVIALIYSKFQMKGWIRCMKQ